MGIAADTKVITLIRNLQNTRRMKSVDELVTRWLNKTLICTVVDTKVITLVQNLYILVE